MFVTNSTCRLKFVLPAFHNSKEITWNARVDEREQSESIYDLIVGQDLMQAIGLMLDFNRGVMCWDGAETPMQQPQWLSPERVDQFEQEMFLMHDPVTTVAERVQRILDVKYAPANLDEEVN